jgi:L-threonylcarbamoyladenylate synthase
MIPVKTDDEAIAILMQGGVGVMPTDTVYGLVARANDKTAVERFYALKQREHKPGTVIAANTQQLIDLGVPAEHIQKVAHWWPNPLSVETPLGTDLNYLHQETGRQAFRVIADERLQQLLAVTGPLVTSSANQPGQPGSVTVQQAYDYFQDAVDFYVDGGDRSGRAPSTIIRITDDGSIEVIRNGAFDISAQPSE